MGAEISREIGATAARFGPRGARSRRSANPAPGGARPPRGGIRTVRPVPRPPLAAKRRSPRPPMAAKGRPRRLGGRENRQPFDLLLPIPPKGRTRRIRPPPRRSRRPSRTGSRPPGSHPRPRRARTPGRAGPAPPYPAQKRPAQPTGRRHTPRQNPTASEQGRVRSRSAPRRRPAQRPTTPGLRRAAPPSGSSGNMCSYRT